MTPDWIVDRVTLTAEARTWGSSAYYKLHVHGCNLSADGERFYWTVRDVADPRYDLTHAVIEPGAMPFLGRDGFIHFEGHPK